MKNGLLTIPDDGEVERILTRRIRERAVLHEWPLSRVERITTADDFSVILKTQLTAASTERAFYRAVRDPALLTPIADGECGGCDWMLLPDLGEAREDWSGLSDEAIRERVRDLRRIIGRLDDGRVPVFFDFSTPEKRADACRTILPTIGEAGMGEEEQHALLAWTEQAKCGDAVLLHGDLKGENVVPTGDGVVLLDWQRPILGPEILEEELALLLSDRESRGEGAALARFVMGYWYAWAYRTCLPYPFVLGMAKKHLRGVLILIST
ncbi:MAG: phosphotransferase [Clostridia bacterium]|nr:phosphotransferase [Clostridia bacterium]